MSEYDAIVKTAKETFAKRIKRALEDKGCDTLVKKAELLGVTDDQIRNYEKGRSFPPAGQLVYFARCLGCSVDYLTDESVTVKTAAADIQEAVKTTGLSERAVEALQSCRSCGADETLKTISALISSDIVPFQEAEGNLLDSLRKIPARHTAYFNGSGTGIQESGLIAALHRNIEADLKYEAETIRLAGMSKGDTTPEELDKWLEQKRKIGSAKTSLENSGYHMMLTCTTATASGQQYHETLKAEYQKGGSDNGSGNE